MTSSIPSRWSDCCDWLLVRESVRAVVWGAVVAGAIGQNWAITVAVHCTVAVQQTLGKLGTDCQVLGLFPAELFAPKVAVAGRLLVDRLLQVQLTVER